MKKIKRWKGRKREIKIERKKEKIDNVVVVVVVDVVDVVVVEFG